jgi:hypothetical protein
LEVQHEAIHDVCNETNEKHDFHRTNQEVGTHEMSEFIERFSTIIHENGCVYGAMHQKKSDEE